MNDDWYKENGWYKPLYPPEAVYAQADSAAPRDIRKKGRFFLWLCVALLLVVAVLLILTVTSPASPEPSNLDKFAEFLENGAMPEDYHDFLDSYYTGATGTRAAVYLPEVKNRGSMELAFAKGTDGEVLSLGELYENSTPSVVYVKAEQQNGSAYSWGTGIIVSSDGYILTNTHVIADCVNAEIGLTDGKTYDAKLVGADSVSDIAILKINAGGLTPAVFAESGTVSVGDSVVAIGNPLGEAYRLTMTDGIISAKDRSVNYNGTVMNLLQTNAAINEGNSGGPLFNERGEVIGITNMKIISALTGVEGIGFAIPSDTIREIASALMDDGAVYGRSTIGITVGAVPDSAAEYYGIPKGLYISAVDKNSDAAKQGVRQGDILTAIDGTEVFTTEDVATIKEKHKIGDIMRFTLWRDGKTLEIEVKLMDANDIYN